MFGFSVTLKRKQPSAMPKRAQLRLEELETRYCPTAPQIMMSAMPASGNMVQVYGHVTDDNPASVKVTLTGIMSGTTGADSSGYFSYLGSASASGTVSAVAQDGAGQTSNTAQAQVLVSAPTVQFGIGELMQNNVTLQGSVTDQNPGGIAVNFSGAVTGSTVTQNDGTFSVTLPASSLGSIQAVVTDSWGLTSSTAKANLTAEPPTIEDFGAAHSYGTCWIFSGVVNGPNTQGEVVTFSGLPTLAGRTATVDSTGHFYLTIELASGETGTASAYVTDCWGQASADVGYLVTRTS